MKLAIRLTVLSAFALVLAAPHAGAQSLSYTKGQNVSPAFEGWEEDANGAKYFLFGYMNRNWEEELNVPVGADNNITPGTPDQGQPTHFLPRRNRFVFRVAVPKSFTEKDEMVWTLTTYGNRRARRRNQQPGSACEQTSRRQSRRSENAEREGGRAAHSDGARH